MIGAFEFGIEEECFLADAASGGSPTEEAADRFHAAAEASSVAVEHELLKGQVEFASPPSTDANETLNFLRTTRRSLANLATDHKLMIFAAGSHPLGSFERQETTGKERYRYLEEQFGIIAHRSTCCAMHVHVTVPTEHDRIRIMNRLIPFLPLLLALSTSSPYWNGEDGGLRCTRLAVFSEWPRMGLPELFTSEADFDRYAARLVGAGNMENASFIWWLIRPSNKYPTLEMRICDSCARVEEAVAIATLYRCLVHAVIRRPIVNDGIGPLDRAIAAENIWQAQRLGIQARFIDARSGAVTSVPETLDAALAMVAEDAAALKCEDWLLRTRDILVGGTSADRQIDVYARERQAGRDERGAMRSVVEALTRETSA